MNKEFLVGVYKEVGKSPDIIKIKNDKAYLEKLVDGEFTTFEYDDYVIIYKKKSDNLLANIYVDRFSKIGLSIKGKIFVVSKDENGDFISLNKEQFFRCTDFLIKKSFNYKNFDEHGRYIPRSKRKNNKTLFKNKNEKLEQEKTSNSSKNQKPNTNQQNSINLQPSIIQQSENQTLAMILKITFIILDFIKGALEDSEDE